MSTKTAILTMTGGPMRFEAVTGSGHTLVMDNGEGDTGPRPSELVPAALAGCTAMDVISILRKKRQEVTSYELQTSGEQAESHPARFLSFQVTHIVAGDDIDVEAVRRAIELSATRYCTVGATLATGDLTLTHSYIVRTRGEEITGEVVVLGPNQAFGAPATAG